MSFEERCKQVDTFLFDVGGIFTDGKITVLGNEVIQSFNSQDIRGLNLLKELKFKFGFISTGKNEAFRKKISSLGNFFYFNTLDKWAAYQEILLNESLSPEKILYMGDEITDLPLLENVGLSATVPEAIQVVLNTCHYITKKSAGNGAVREILDLVFLHKKISFS
jgi:3-deoxy-D-manno-octulosonate 8-phosphate phosphatase (KDO 8-P phosphatase)